MRKFFSLVMIALMFCAVISVGCGGGSDNDAAEPEQTESLNNDTGSEDTSTDPNEEGRGNSGSTGTIRVHIDTASAWAARTMSFYAQKSDGTWDRLKSWEYYVKGNGETTTGNKDFDVPSSYVAFGFEVNVLGGTEYPYSKVFWTPEKVAEFGQPTKINIDLAGSSRMVDITISVNGGIVDSDTNCASHIPYGWNGITVTFDRGGGYSYKSSGFYGRKSSTSPWVKLITPNDSASSATLHSDVTQRTHNDKTGGQYSSRIITVKEDYYTIPRSYVEFGFEFDVRDGTDWPYSDVFWTASRSANTTVDTIKCETGGAIRSASVYIYVNDKIVVRQLNCDSHSQHDWSYGLIKVEIKDTGVFTTKYSNFMARKAGGTWETLYSRSNGDDLGIHGVPSEYVDFGFEYDIKWSYDWPYSRPFWIGADHPGCTVTNIFVEISGYIGAFGNPHIDITVKGYDANGNYGDLQSPISLHDLTSGTRYNW